MVTKDPDGHQRSGAAWTPRIRRRMDTKDPDGHQGSGWTPRIRRQQLPIGAVVPGSVRLAFWGGSVYSTRSGWNKGRSFHFEWWKRLRWDSWIIPLLEPLVLSLLCDGFASRKGLHECGRRLHKTVLTARRPWGSLTKLSYTFREIPPQKTVETFLELDQMLLSIKIESFEIVNTTQPFQISTHLLQTCEKTFLFFALFAGMFWHLWSF